jgi:hypothetical protein
MSTHKGKPSGVNKPENGTGIPSDNLKNNEELTGKYTENDEKISEQVRVKHPNRNVDKLHPTNAGGYKNR